MLCTALSDNSGTLNGIRENIVVFVPFVFGLVALVWTGFRGIMLDTYRTSIGIRTQLEDELKTVDQGSSNHVRIVEELKFINSSIENLSRKIKKRPWSSRFSLWISGSMFLVGIFIIGFGDKASILVSAIKEFIKCI